MISQPPTLIALGNFDGIHRGHRQVIEPVLRSPLHTHPNARKVVVSFTPHPQAFFSRVQRPLLTPLEEKQAYIRRLGLDDVVLLPFDQTMAQLSPTEFVERVLLEQLNVQFISVGQNFRFGHRRVGTAADLRAIASVHQVPVHIAPLHCSNGDRISSSAIRAALSEGDMDQANRLLGRPYRLIGTVVKGQQLGRTIGFPTANLSLPADKFLPRQGVYAVRVALADSSPSPPESSLLGVMNMGTRPTVNGLSQTIEVHLLDWSGDLYDQTLWVDLHTFLRPEQTFDSLDQLKQQISTDCETARSYA